MADKIDIKVQAEQVQARINQLLAAGANMTPAWDAVGSYILNRIKLGFRLSKDPWGKTWLPIKWRALRKGKDGISATGRKQAYANAAGKAGQPLVDTGRFRRSIVSRASAKDVVIGTSMIQARVHQFGAVIKPKKGKYLVYPGPTGGPIFSRVSKIPARPYLPINQSGQLAIPPGWSAGIIRTLAAHFKLASRGTNTGVTA